MVRRSLPLSALLLVNVFIMLGYSSAAVSYEEPKIVNNLLKNSGFESTECLQNWSSEGSASFRWIQDWHSYRGKWSFGVGNDADGAQDNAYAVCYQVISIPGNSGNIYPVKPGDVFTFGIWVKAEEGYRGTAIIKLEYFKHDRRQGLRDGPIKSYRSTRVITSRCDWQKITVSGEAPEGAVSAAVVCASEKMSNGSKFVFFDEGRAAVK